MLIAHPFWLLPYLLLSFYLFSELAEKFFPKICQKVSHHVLVTFTIYYAWTIISSWPLSFLNLLKPFPIIIYTLFFYGILFLVTFRNKKQNLFLKSINSLKNLSIEEKILICIFSAWIILSVFKIYILSPNNFDSLTTHLFNSAIWLQNGNLGNVNTSSFLTTGYPINPYLLNIFLLAHSANNRFCELVQIISWGVTCLSMYSVLILFNVPRIFSISFSMLFISSPILLAISFTNQTDMTLLASFGLVCFYCALFIKRYSLQNILLLSISLGIFLGSKQHGILMTMFILPWMLVVFLMQLNKLSIQQKILHPCLVAFSLLLLGMPKYLMNFFTLGSLVPADFSGSDDTLKLSQLIYNLKMVWPEIFFDKPWSFTGGGVWQHNTSCYGLYFSFILLPGISAGLCTLKWKNFKELLSGPFVYFIFSFCFFLVFGLGSQNSAPNEINTFEFDPRKYVVGSLGLAIFGSWGIWQMIHLPNKIRIITFTITSILLMQISGWYCGHTLRRVLVSLVGLFIFLIAVNRLNKSNIKLGGFLIVLMTISIVPYRYWMSHQYNFHANNRIIQASLKKSFSERTFIMHYYLIPGRALDYILADSLVAQDGILLVENDKNEKPLYLLFGTKHQRKVRFLTDFRDSNEIESSIHNIRKYLDINDSVWVMLPHGKAYLDSIYKLNGLKAVSKVKLKSNILLCLKDHRTN